ncbi:MAG: hypothetical protein JST82_14750 [Bacteroidetes bacterium]|nr:hypothetical protein [Bacteroidota bacterium]
MKLVSKIGLVTVACLVAVSLIAQQKNTADNKAKKPKPIYVPVYLGKSDLSSGNITKRVFDSLLMQGVRAQDSAGRVFTVNGFLFSYGERNLYEDSVGNPMVLTDYMTEYCKGDTLTTFIKKNISERSKAGDTVYIDQIMLTSPEGKMGEGRPMRFVIKR